MVGIVVIAHGGLSEELINTTGMIVEKPPPGVTGVSITGEEEPEDIQQMIKKAIDSVDEGDGVVLFTDMFGGTPSNIALSFLADNQVEIISGVNLPMLIDIMYTRESKSLAEIASQLAETGRSSIRLASQYLKGKN